MRQKVRNSYPHRLLPRMLAYGAFLTAGLFLFTPGDLRAAMENHFLYFPEKMIDATPASLRLAFEEVNFPAADGTALHGWFVPGAKNKPVVLFLHGNAGNISHRIDNLYWLNRKGFSTFIFDYRGYGRSAGTPSEPGLYDDARGALAWLKQHKDTYGHPIYFGRSLGAAVALQLAIEEPPAALIMESPFTSVAAMGKTHYPLLHHLLGWLIAANYDNERKIEHLRTPLLLIHGTADTIVPAAMGKRLFDLAPAPKKLYLVEGADHNDGFYLDGPDYWDAWTDFLECTFDPKQRQNI